MNTMDNLKAVGLAFVHGIAFREFKSSLQDLTTQSILLETTTDNRGSLGNSFAGRIWKGLEFSNFILGTIIGVVTVIPFCVFLISLLRRTKETTTESVQKEETPSVDHSETVEQSDHVDGKQLVEEYDLDSLESHPSVVSVRREQRIQGEKMEEEEGEEKKEKDSILLLNLKPDGQSIPVFTKDSKPLENSIYVVVEGSDSYNRILHLGEDGGEHCLGNPNETTEFVSFFPPESSSLQRTYKVDRFIKVPASMLESPLESGFRHILGEIVSSTPKDPRVAVIFLIDGKVGLPSENEADTKDYAKAATQLSWKFLNRQNYCRGEDSNYNYDLTIVVNDSESYDVCNSVIGEI